MDPSQMTPEVVDTAVVASGFGWAAVGVLFLDKILNFANRWIDKAYAPKPSGDTQKDLRLAFDRIKAGEEKMAIQDKIIAKLTNGET